MAFGRKNKKSLQKKWRPDFRDVQTLPDTKVIRTGFLLNFMAIALSLVVISMYIVREYSLQSMKGEVANLQAQVEASTSQNRVYLDANKRFKEKAAIVSEAIDFDRQIMDFPALVAELPAIIPGGMILSAVEMEFEDQMKGKNKNPPFIVTFKGRVTGRENASSSQIVTQFQQAILETQQVQPLDASTDLIRFNRNNEFGFFDFTLQLTVTVKTDSKS